MGFPRDFPRESCRDRMAGLRPAPPPGGRPSACHSIPPTFPQEIPRKTHTFPPLVNKNIPVFVQATAWYLYSDIHLIPTATATKEKPFFTINGNYTFETASCPGPALLLGYNSNLHYQSVLPIDEQKRVEFLDPQTIDSVLSDVRRGEKQSYSGEHVTLLQADVHKEKVSSSKLTDITE